MNPYLSSSHSPRSLHPKLPHCQAKRNIFSVSKPSVSHFLLRHDSPSRRLQSPDTITTLVSGLGRVSCFDSRERSSEKVSQILCQLYFPWFSHHTSKGYCSKSVKSFSCFGIFIPKKVGKLNSEMTSIYRILKKLEVFRKKEPKFTKSWYIRTNMERVGQVSGFGLVWNCPEDLCLSLVPKWLIRTRFQWSFLMYTPFPRYFVLLRNKGTKRKCLNDTIPLAIAPSSSRKDQNNDFLNGVTSLFSATSQVFGRRFLCIMCAVITRIPSPLYFVVTHIT